MQCAFLRPDRFRQGPRRESSRRSSCRPPTDSPGSYRLEEYAADGVTLVRSTALAAGLPCLHGRILDGDGVLDHRVWYARRPAGSREPGPVEKRVFQVTETWSDGRLASESIDTNGDGIPDYRETYGASGT